MGLDCIWVNPNSDDPAPLNGPDITEEFPGICGGLFSGNGRASFRGKVYNTWFEENTGVSLYQERIPNPTLRAALAELHQTLAHDQDYDFLSMFEAHVLAGHDLISWW